MILLLLLLLLLPFTRPSSILSITGRDQTGYTVYMLVSVCFHNLVTYAQRLQDLYSACLTFWMRTHTGPRFIVLSEGRESHQPQGIWASHTNSKILVPDGARTLRRTTGSLKLTDSFLVIVQQQLLTTSLIHTFTQFRSSFISEFLLKLFYF
jgi:hypothetical protein